MPDLSSNEVMCGVCADNTPYTQDRFQHHLVSEHEEEIVCHLCGKHYSRLDTLTFHLKNCHNTEKQGFSCSACSYKNTGLCRYQKHLKTYHTEESSKLLKEVFQCSLNIPLVKGSSPKPSAADSFVCASCPFKAKSVQKLNDHMLKAHKDIMEEKDVVTCAECGLKVRNNRKLQKHMQTSHQHA